MRTMQIGRIAAEIEAAIDERTALYLRLCGVQRAIRWEREFTTSAGTETALDDAAHWLRRADEIVHQVGLKLEAAREALESVCPLLDQPAAAEAQPKEAA